MNSLKTSLKNFAQDLWWSFQHGPKDQAEKTRQQILKNTISSLPPLLGEGSTQVFSEWNRNRQKLRNDLRKKDPRNFLRFPVVQYTMFHESKKSEYDFLKQQGWWDKWSQALTETSTGNPRPYSYDKSTSGNLVHTAYNLARFLTTFPTDISKIKRVTEFGGGYGAMARLFFNLGFTGEYIIYDLPEFSAIQKYYLDSHSLHLVQTISDLKDLQKVTSEPHSPTLFIATWSISESPVELREKIFNLVTNSDLWLMAYQPKFENTDNKKYFESFIKNHLEISWRQEAINHLPHQTYIFGKK